ncbi:MAG: DNA polymerase IV [Pseudomonadota bacterium]
MTDLNGEKSLCGDCGELAPPGATQCPACLSHRIITHPEINSLSIAHIDCDAFYASVEKRDNPDLQDVPVIVGGGQRGVVTTACYIARTYGVRSAMPMFKALKACPEAVVVKPDFSKYTAASRAVRAQLDTLTPLVEPLSIDEAFLDLTGTEKIHNGTPAQTLVRLQQRIARDVGITISVGLSHNKFLAKLASDLEKPRGFSVIGVDETQTRMAAMPLGKIWGVGQALEARLSKDGMRTVADLQALERDELIRKYGTMGDRLWHLAHGIDRRSVTPSRASKSVSSETTFNDDVFDLTELTERLWPLCEKVSMRMKDKALAGRVACLKLKSADFKSVTKRATLADPSNLARTLFHACAPLLSSAFQGGTGYRLIGTGYADLVPADTSPQSEMFERQEHKWARQENAVDSIREKFGTEAIASGRAIRKTTSSNATQNRGQSKKTPF